MLFPSRLLLCLLLAPHAHGHATLAYRTLFYDNAVDHTARGRGGGPPATFSHRYLLNDDFYGTAPLTPACPGPIFLYAGNEGPITEFWEGNGFLHYLAAQYGGLLVFPEERYYGASFPTAPPDYTYLSTGQILGDYVQLLDDVRRRYAAEACPAYAFGGSYGGTLAAYLRAAHPEAVQGALASSAELGYYDRDAWAAHHVTEYTFAEIIGAQYDRFPGCLAAIGDATDALEDADDEVLMRTFRYCDATALLPGRAAAFLYGLEGLPQLNYPYAVGPRPAWPVARVCALLTDASRTLLERAAAADALAQGYAPDGACRPTLPEGPGNVPGDGPGKGSWGYQSCTETLHTFSSHGREGRGIRPFNYTEEGGMLADRCRELYGVVPDVQLLTQAYGGYQIARTASHIIFSVGALDPWGGAGLTADDGGPDARARGMYFFRMARGAHHLDLRGWHDDDPPDVTAVRRQEEAILAGWMAEWAEDAAAAGAGAETGVAPIVASVA
mmetsp:Transcript_41376/g.81054  ORF Transcript_41376/g.81054 Transcript_41376/m.81054 type:complete len:499 (+) Transcript_41376:89-1585(+)